jgi:predicted membrane protein
MKMGSGMFWGILLIIIGVSLILKIIFHVDFPIFKIIVAFALIYLGIKILIGPSFKIFNEHKDEQTIVFGKGEFNDIKSEKEYNVVFGKADFDLRTLALDTLTPTKIRMNTVFGNSKVILPPNMPVKIEVDAAFAGVTLPNGNTASFGSSTYTTKNFDSAMGYLHIKADAVFGSLEFEQKNY